MKEENNSNLIERKSSKLWLWILISLVGLIFFSSSLIYPLIIFIVLIILIYYDKNKLNLGLFYVYIFSIFITQNLAYYLVLTSRDYGMGILSYFYNIWVAQALVIIFTIIFFEYREYKKTGNFKIIQKNKITPYIFNFLIIGIILLILLGVRLWQMYKLNTTFPYSIGSTLIFSDIVAIILIFFVIIRFLLEIKGIRWIYLFTFIGLIFMLYTFPEIIEFHTFNLNKINSFAEDKLAIDQNDITLCKSARCKEKINIKTKNVLSCKNKNNINFVIQCVHKMARLNKDELVCNGIFEIFQNRSQEYKNNLFNSCIFIVALETQDSSLCKKTKNPLPNFYPQDYSEKECLKKIDKNK